MTDTVLVSWHVTILILKTGNKLACWWFNSLLLVWGYLLPISIEHQWRDINYFCSVMPDDFFLFVCLMVFVGFFKLNCRFNIWNLVLNCPSLLVWNYNEFWEPIIQGKMENSHHSQSRTLNIEQISTKYTVHKPLSLCALTPKSWNWWQNMVMYTQKIRIHLYCFNIISDNK